MEIKTILQSIDQQSHWSMSYTTKILGEIYMKLSMIDTMERLYNEGKEDFDFIITSRSIGITADLPKENSSLIIDYDDSNFVFLASKGEDYKLFWKKFHTLRRPLIMCRNADGRFEPIYFENNALVFNKIELNSPQKYHIIANPVISLLLGTIISTAMGNTLNRIFPSYEQAQILEDTHAIRDNQIESFNRQERARRMQIQIIEQNEQILEMLNRLESLEYQNNNRKGYDFLENEKRRLLNNLKKHLHKSPMVVTNLEVD